MSCREILCIKPHYGIILLEIPHIYKDARVLGSDSKWDSILMRPLPVTPRAELPQPGPHLTHGNGNAPLWNSVGQDWSLSLQSRRTDAHSHSFPLYVLLHSLHTLPAYKQCVCIAHQVGSVRSSLLFKRMLKNNKAFPWGFPNNSFSLRLIPPKVWFPSYFGSCNYSSLGLNA